MLDDATVQMLRRHWEEGWNGRDLDTIMAPFADDVVFSSPGIAMMTRDPSQTTIRGSAALREYLEHALRLTTDVRYRLHAAYAGTDSIVLVYSCGIPNGTQRDGADSMRLDGDGRVVEWRCHF